MESNDNYQGTGWRVYYENQEKLSKGEFYLSVTTILSSVYHRDLISWMKEKSKNHQEKALESAGEHGTMMHDILEAYENKALGEIDNEARLVIKDWETIKEKYRIEVIETERFMSHNILWIAGRCDFIGRFYNPIIKKQMFGVGDYKTGSKYSIKSGWQMAAYLEMLKQEEPEANGMIGIHIPRYKGFGQREKPRAFPYQHIDFCWQTYLSCYKVFCALYFNELKKLKWRGMEANNMISIDCWDHEAMFNQLEKEAQS